MNRSTDDITGNSLMGIRKDNNKADGGVSLRFGGKEILFDAEQAIGLSNQIASLALFAKEQAQLYNYHIDNGKTADEAAAICKELDDILHSKQHEEPNDPDMTVIVVGPNGTEKVSMNDILSRIMQGDKAHKA